MENSPEKTKKHPRQPFNQEEDDKLIHLVQSYNEKEINWEEVSSQMSNRNIRQCKERWDKYLNPNLSVDPWTSEEDDIITNMHLEFGPKWTLMANILGNRTDIMVRNRWNVIYRKAMKNKKKKNKDMKVENTSKANKVRKKSKSELKKVENKNDDNIIIKKDTVDIKNKDLLAEPINQLELNIFDQLIRTNDFYDFDMFI